MKINEVRATSLGTDVQVALYVRRKNGRLPALLTVVPADEMGTVIINALESNRERARQLRLPLPDEVNGGRNGDSSG